MLIKFIGSLVLVATGILSAFELARYHKRRLQTLDGIISLIFYIKGQVDCFARPIGDILKDVPPRVVQDCNCLYGIESLDDVADASKIYLDDECLRLLCSFASEFGSNFREEQVRRCDYYISLLNNRRSAIEAKVRSDSRAGSAVCICASLFLLILLW